MSDKISLYTAGTPNGMTASIFAEELKAAYDKPEYENVIMSIRDADIGKVENQVKSPWFLEVNPNGKIPAIKHGDNRVFETSAVLVYLSQVYDKEHKFSKDPATDLKGWGEEQSWLYFLHGGIGPLQGQTAHFAKFAPEKIPYAIERFTKETNRLYAVVEAQLAKQPYLTGESYGIADIKAFGWMRFAGMTGIEIEQYPNIQKWLEKLEARPAVKAGIEKSKGN